MKWYLRLILIAVILGTVGFLSNKVNTLQGQLVEAKLSTTHDTVLPSGIHARLAQEALVKDSLQRELLAAKQLNGKLLAAAHIKVQPESTTTKTDTLTVKLGTDSTRTAYVNDSTSVGWFRATLIAPPCCEKLQLQYTIVPNPLEIKVAFIRVAGDRAVFAVDYNGGHEEVTSAYSQIPAEASRATWYISGLWALSGISEARVGASMRLFEGINLQGEAAQALISAADAGKFQTFRMLVGIRKDFRLF